MIAKNFCENRLFKFNYEATVKVLTRIEDLKTFG